MERYKKILYKKRKAMKKSLLLISMVCSLSLSAMDGDARKEELIKTYNASKPLTQITAAFRFVHDPRYKGVFTDDEKNQLIKENSLPSTTDCSRKDSLKQLALSEYQLKSESDDGQIGSVSWSADDAQLISTNYAAGLKVWDVATQKLERKVPFDNTTGAFYSHDGKQLMVKTDDAIDIIDLRSWKTSKKIDGKKINIDQAAWNHENTKIAGFDSLFGQSFYVIDVQTGTVEPFSYENNDYSFLRSVGWNADGSALFSVAQDQKVVEWNPVTKEKKVVYELNNQKFPHTGDFVFNRDCSKVAAVLISTNYELMSLSLHDLKYKKPVFSRGDVLKQFSACGSSLSLSEQDTLSLGGWWDITLSDKNYSLTVDIDDGAPFTSCISWNNSGSAVALGSITDTLRLYSLRENESPQQYQSSCTLQ